VIGRLARIVGAYLAASLAAGIAVALTLVSRLIAALVQADTHARMLAPPNPVDVFLWTTWLTGGLAAVYAFIPAALIIAFAEARDLRSAAYYSGAGIVAAIAALSIMFRTLHLVGSDLLILGAGGGVGGLVYWWIAGRSAGDWRGAPPAHP
jgi:NADPH:quinone reductase-like Zn-dependent oxidoreductase